MSGEGRGERPGPIGKPEGRGAENPRRKIDGQSSFLGIPLRAWSSADRDGRVLVIRIVAGVLLAGTGFLLFAIGAARGITGLFHMLFGMMFLVGAAACFGSIVSRKCARTVSDLLFPDSRFDRPRPLYSLHEGNRAKGRFEEAIEGFLEIAIQYPKEVHPWIQLIDIAFVDLSDPVRAKEFFHRGLSVLEGEEARRQLARQYKSHLDSWQAALSERRD